MDTQATTAIFLITGLITACGSHEAMPILQKVKTKVVNKQYLEAIFAAEQIVTHYPDTAYAESARELIKIINKYHLDNEYQPNIC
jgi:outer membrane protein assembly factor BamD (BamD/ComL family)